VPLAGCGLSFQTLPQFSKGIGPHYTVKATFADVLNLPTDAQVRIGPQVVGAVSSIGTKDFAAQVDLDIKDSVHLPVGTTAQVRFDNPLGDQYVLLTLPAQAGSRMLGPGEPLASSDTSSAPSVEDAFGALSTVLNGGGINQLQTIVHELNATFDGNQQQIHDLLGQIDTAVSSLADGRGAVDDALAAIDRLGQQLNAGSGTLTAGIDALAPAVSTLAAQNGELSDLLTNFASLSDVANRIVAQSGADSVRGVQALLPVLDQLVGVKERLNQDLRDVAQFEQLTPGKAPGDYLQFGLTLNVALPAGPASPAAVRTAPASTGAAAVQSLLQGGLR
jgi:phospholipid/cholesterol/gamma-HCH transport system substrate-binding protein